MAIIHGGLSRISIRYPSLDLKGIKFIGWGAGQFFKNFYQLVGIDISYTICPYLENQGKIIHGIEVRSPDALANEDPEKIFILIFSGSCVEITHQINSLGKFKSIQALEYGTRSHDILQELGYLQKNIDCPPPPKQRFSDIGFFTQGPILPFTELALAYQRYRYPNDYHCLVTDTGQSPEILSRCARWVDDIIEVDAPKTPGPLRRNYMIRTAKAGAEIIHRKGLKYSVRVRSGNIILGDVRRYINASFGIQGNYQAGKIGFHMGWTMRNMPFQISEAFMLSRSEDMLALWSIPEDNRSSDDPSLHVSPDMHYSQFVRLSNENYVWSSYAAILGIPNSTLEDSLNFMRAKLIPLEPDLDTFSLKYIPLFSMEYDNSVIPDKQWWNSLINNFDHELDRSLAILGTSSTISDHFSRKIG